MDKVKMAFPRFGAISFGSMADIFMLAEKTPLRSGSNSEMNGISSFI